MPTGTQAAPKSWVRYPRPAYLQLILTIQTETLFDILELYTHHRSSTSVGPRFPADRFLTVRIPLNQEASEHRIPRYAHWIGRPRQPYNVGNAQNSTRPKDADTQRPHHPLTPTAANGDRHRTSDRGKDAAVRFMLDHDIADCEKRQVAEYFRVEMEEYEVDA